MLSFLSYLYTSFLNILVILICIIGIFYLFKKPLYTFYIVIFTLPFKSLYLWVGTNIEIWKILSAASLLIYGPTFLLKSYNRIKSNRYFHLLLFYIFYAVLMTIIFIFVIPEQDKHTVTGGFFKNEGRYIYQIGLFLLTINLILWPIYVIKNEEELFKVFKIMVYSVVVLSILGIVQELSVNFINYDPFPIHRPTGFDYEGGSLVIPEAETRHRMNSLAGEPKHLGIALIVGIMIILLHKLNGKKIIKYDFAFLTIFLICLVSTYSTTGYVWYGVVVLVIAILYNFKLSKNIIGLLIAAGITMLAVYYSTGGEPTPYIVKTINKVGLEVQDEAVFDFLKKEPYYAITGLGLGNVHFYANDYLPPRFPLFRDTPFKGNSGFFLLLGDIGFLGIFMLSVFIIGLIRSNKKLSNSFNGTLLINDKILIHFTIIASAMFLLRYFEFFFVILGMMLYLHNIYSYNQKKSRLSSYYQSRI